jgi:hypothetical protein
MEGVAVQAHDLGSIGKVAEFLRPMEQAELALDTPCLGGNGLIS